MPIEGQLAPQIEQFIHDNPQGVLTSFRRNGMPQLSIVTVYPVMAASVSPLRRTASSSRIFSGTRAAQS